MSALPRAITTATETTSDLELCRALGANDWQAFDVLYRRYVRDVYLYVHSIVRERESTEEVTQDVWSALWKARHKLVMHGTSLLPWLLVTSRHVSLRQRRSAVRRDAKERALHHDLTEPRSEMSIRSAESRAELQELHDFIEAPVESMTTVDQQIFHLCLVEGMTYDDAASRLKMPVSTLRGRLHRVRKSLRRSLSEAKESP